MPPRSTGPCYVCGEEAHGYQECPEPLRIPSRPRRPRETLARYHYRLRYNAYMRKWMQEHPSMKTQRNASMRAARRDPNNPMKIGERARNVKHRASKRERVDAIKAAPCMDCGGRFPSECMDFDHRDPATKNRKWSSPGMMPGRAKWETFLAEIAKCDLVCANCHRTRTRARKRGARYSPRAVAA